MLEFESVLVRTIANLAKINSHGNLGVDAEGSFRGYYRRAYSDAEQNVKNLILELATQEYGAEVEWDRAGNLHLTIPGTSGKYLAFGSHPDTVNGGGAYDGTLGLIDGLEILGAASRMHQRALGVRLIVMGGEENSFGRSLKGSAMLHGLLDEMYLSRMDKQPDGSLILLQDAMALQGADPQAVRDRVVIFDEVDGKNCIGYVEFHIEQGLRLKRAGVPIGIVNAISGSTRPKFELRGRGGHTSEDRVGDSIRSGGEVAPSEDAMQAFVEGATTVYRYRDEMMQLHPDLTIACGSSPQLGGGVTAYPDAVMPTFDIRSANDALRGNVADSVASIMGEAASRQGVEFIENQRPSIPGLPSLDTNFIELMQVAADGLSISTIQTQSRASHDALYFGIKNIPTIMVFIRDQWGISHKPEELADMEDNAQAVLVGWDFYQRLNAQYAA